MVSSTKELPGQHVPEIERPFAGLTESLDMLDGIIREVAPDVKLFARFHSGSYNRDGTFLVFFTHRDQPAELRPNPHGLHPDNAFFPYSDRAIAISDRSMYLLTITPPITERKTPTWTKKAQPVDPILEKVSGLGFPDNSLDNFIKLITEKGGQVQITSPYISPYGFSVENALREAVRAQLFHKPERSVPEQILLDNFDFYGDRKLQPGETVEGRIDQVVKDLIHWKGEQWMAMNSKYAKADRGDRESPAGISPTETSNNFLDAIDRRISTQLVASIALGGFGIQQVNGLFAALAEGNLGEVAWKGFGAAALFAFIPRVMRLRDTDTREPQLPQLSDLEENPPSLRRRFGDWINDPKLYEQGLGGLLFNPNFGAEAFERASLHWKSNWNGFVYDLEREAYLLKVDLSAVLRKLPERFVRQTIEGVVTKQVNRLIALKFHEELGLSVEEYRQAFILPEGTAQPENYKKRFDTLLVVDPRIPLTRQHALAGVFESINSADITNLTEVLDTPYAVWTHDSRRNAVRPEAIHGYLYRLSPQEAIERFAKDEVGSPQIEVTALFLQHLEYFTERNIQAGGSRGGEGDIPGIDNSYFWLRRDNKALLNLREFNQSYNNMAVLSRGQDIIRFGA